MMSEEKPFPNILNTMPGGRYNDKMYPCILDLLKHGIDLSRFSADERKPHYQDITQYLAAWSRHAGMSENESRGWLIDYCIGTYSSISTRTPAVIRHNTKSNLRYIYRSEVPFLCQCANNSFHAQCSSDCPVYAEMQENLRVKANEALNPRVITRPPATVFEPVISVKTVNLEQFQAAMLIAIKENRKGITPGPIANLLNESGFKTRTGKKWSSGIVSYELNNLKKPHVLAQDG